MDLKQHVVFGRTGLTVSRMGLASGYGVPTAAIEKAFHEYGLNYLWLSLFLPLHMVRAVRNLAPGSSDPGPRPPASARWPRRTATVSCSRIPT